MAKVVVYSSTYCYYCMRAKRLLESKGVDYTEYSVDGDPHRWNEMVSLTQRHTVPQIFIGDLHVGGCDDLHELERDKRLDELLGLD